MTTVTTCSDIGKCIVQSGDICSYPDGSQLKQFSPVSRNCALAPLEGTWAGADNKFSSLIKKPIINIGFF